MKKSREESIDGPVPPSSGQGHRGEEAGRSPVFRSPAHRATVALFQTTDLLRRFLTGVVQAEGVTLQQFNVLRILRGAGEEGLATLTVGERMVEKTPGVTRLLDRLEREGLVHRERCQVDRRRVLARITPEGRQLLSRIDEPMAQAEDSVLGTLGDEGLERLSDLLAGLRRELDERGTG